mgnify:CR=1 FL=1
MNLIASAEKSWKTSWTARVLHRPRERQPFRYYLAWENEEVDRIQKLTNWARALPQMQLPHPGMCPTGFIIICQDLNLGASIPRYQKDVGIVAQTMLLAAAERGLGGCMIGNYNADSVKKNCTSPKISLRC